MSRATRRRGRTTPKRTGGSDRARFEAWLADGYRHGWIIGGFCANHDLPPATDEEREAADEMGGEDAILDACLPSLRVAVPGQRVTPASG